MMGSGKSTVGRILARRWGRRFLDSDEVIERRLDRTVAEIFRSEGEA
ncbi:shikimate kinase, partial [cyanobacterium TDX16]